MSVPVIDSLLTLEVPVRVGVRYRIHATQQPTSFNAVGLPAQLSITFATGLISGKITDVGVSNVTISATNADGTGSATLVITATDQGGGGGGQSGPVSVFQAKYWKDDTELADFSDFDEAGQPIVDFNPNSVGATQLATTAISKKMALVGGPGRILQYVLPEAFTLPIQQRYTSRLCQIVVAGAKVGDYVLMGELLDENGVYLGDTTLGGTAAVRNLIFSGTANTNQVSIYVWTAGGGGPLVLPAKSRINFRLFSNPSA